ncbi:NADP-dependent malic enzyme [Selenomonas sp. TAMA-11512]|uniref:NAD(P)-dependent malic enzyme n=1 Tax=Selenomonas sp. TAMA-11512 TaxID=3095337 RepID=UPI0030862593|nr:NADP-dependent malic enzyme [Selenomonas sp. TAMA-11512]
MTNIDREALEFHKKFRGKIDMQSRVSLNSPHDLTLAYTPGVAAPCLAIKEDPDKVFDYTGKGNLVAVVTNGTAVLGLGNIGPAASLPVMEGKAALFMGFAGVEAVPVCLASASVDEICRAVEMMEPGFGGINLEDIKAPECFDIEKRLRKTMNIPVMHDDQHGTAIVVVSALINALRLVGKNFPETKVVINGAGAAGMAIARLVRSTGAENIILCDTEGAIYKDRPENMNPYKADIAAITNIRREKGLLADVLKGADVFIGVSKANVLSEEMVKSMAKDSIIMAMANPTPEIMPDLAKKSGARVVCTGRSDFPNQVNNLLAFPGIFRGAMDVRAADINEEMKVAAAHAIASLIREEELDEEHVIVSALDRRVAPAVAKAVAKAALDTGIAQRTDISPEDVEKHTIELTVQN